MQKFQKGRYGFEGEIAEKEIRDKYVGKRIEYKKGEQSSFKYFLPSHKRVPNKNEPINKEKICNNYLCEILLKVSKFIDRGWLFALYYPGIREKEFTTDHDRTGRRRWCRIELRRYTS